MTIFNPATGLAEGSFGIGTFTNSNSKPFPAVVNPDGTVFSVKEHYTDTMAIFEDWERAFDVLEKVSKNGTKDRYQFNALHALPPVARPNLLCTGANYRQHVAEMMTRNKFNQHNRQDGETDEQFFQRNLEIIDKRAREGIPYFWTGLHSSLVGANDNVVLPLIGEQPDWELEFAAVLSGTGRYYSPDETENLIAGYVMVNDLGTVDEFRRTDVQWGFDWVSKHQPSFKPAGPFIVPKQFVNRNETRIKLSVNGETKQDWPISDMIFSVEQVLSYASERISLMPGDMLLTGSPPGNGAVHGQFLKPGDIIDSEITYLGRQRNNVVAEETGGRKPHFGPFV